MYVWVVSSLWGIDYLNLLQDQAAMASLLALGN